MESKISKTVLGIIFFKQNNLVILYVFYKILMLV